MMWMMKKQTVVALVLLLLIPVVAMLGGLLFSMINPEIAAGHANALVSGYKSKRISWLGLSSNSD